MKKSNIVPLSVGSLALSLILFLPGQALSLRPNEVAQQFEREMGYGDHDQASDAAGNGAPTKDNAEQNNGASKSKSYKSRGYGAKKKTAVAFKAAQPVASRHKIFQYMPDSSRSFGTENMLSELSKEVAGKIFYELKEEGQRNLTSRVAVVAAVPLSDLKRETEFGRIIAEYYLTDLADRGIRVKELRLGSDINILPQTGEFILSRNIGELANNSPALDYVVVSTFTNTRKTLILQGRMVSLKSGLIKSSWRFNLPLNRELLGLFYSIEQPFTIAVKGIGQ